MEDFTDSDQNDPFSSQRMESKEKTNVDKHGIDVVSGSKVKEKLAKHILNHESMGYAIELDEPKSPTNWKKVKKSKKIFESNAEDVSSMMLSDILLNDDSPAKDANIMKPLLGKIQAKRRLQAFSLSKRVPAKILSPLKAPKHQVSIEERYDENGELMEEQIVIVRKPPKTGPCPQEKAKAVISEIEEIKRREALQIPPSVLLSRTRLSLPSVRNINRIAVLNLRQGRGISSEYLVVM